MKLPIQAQPVIRRVDSVTKFEVSGGIISSDCIGNCRKVYDGAQLACNRLPTPAKLACHAVAAGAWLACQKYCLS